MNMYKNVIMLLVGLLNISGHVYKLVRSGVYGVVY